MEADVEVEVAPTQTKKRKRKRKAMTRARAKPPPPRDHASLRQRGQSWQRKKKALATRQARLKVQQSPSALGPPAAVSLREGDVLARRETESDANLEGVSSLWRVAAAPGVERRSFEGSNYPARSSGSRTATSHKTMPLNRSWLHP